MSQKSLVYAIPTDTCYGLACGFSDRAGYEQIYTLKGREARKPTAIVVETFDDVEKMIFITQSQKEFLRTYPYPFTILGKPRKIPDFCDSAMYALFGVRVAEVCLPEDIGQTLTFPIFLTSANKSGEKELFTAHEVRTVFGDAVEILGHESAGRSPSNIFQFVGDTTEIAFTRQNYPHI